MRPLLDVLVDDVRYPYGTATERADAVSRLAWAIIVRAERAGDWVACLIAGAALLQEIGL